MTHASATHFTSLLSIDVQMNEQKTHCPLLSNLGSTADAKRRFQIISQIQLLRVNVYYQT